jgi:adenylyltransferase/sulfurtransferase
VHVIAAFQVAQSLKIIVGESTPQEILQIDVWNGTWKTIRAEKARNQECRCCGKHQFHFLEGQEHNRLARLCGRNAVQISPPRPTRSDFQKISKRLEKTAQIDLNEYLLRIRVDGYEIALFADGRSIIRGTDDFTEARALYAKYIGS